MQQGNYNFLGCSEKSNFTQKVSDRVILKKIKNSSKKMLGTHLNLDHKKPFSKKLYNNRRVYSQNYREQLSLATLRRVHSNSK